METNQTKTTSAKVLRGTVIKSAMQDTATVLVQRYTKDPKYKKYMKQTKKYLVHDPGNTAEVGSQVEIRETKPISKRKSFEIVK
jgi:small subunit ribosomal protein S17